MNIRIGNDITLNVALNANELLGRPILGADAYLVHDTSITNVLSSKSNILSDYMIHGCGAPHYFGGVGVFPHDRGFHVCGHNHLRRYPLHVDIVSNTELRCRFLSEFQKELGDYRLVVNVAVKECCGRKVYTYDFGNAFCLTNDENDLSGDVIVDLPNDEDGLVAIEPITKIVTVPAGSSLSVGEIDFYGREYGFKILTQHSTSLKYHANGSFSNIAFSSKIPSAVTISNGGTITAAQTTESKNIVIEAYDSTNENIKAQMIVHVVGSESDETTVMYTTQVVDPITEETQHEINERLNNSIQSLDGKIDQNVKELNSKIYVLENKEAQTQEGLPIMIATQAQYDQWLLNGEIRRGVFYYIYDEEDNPDNPDLPDNPDNPDIPTPTGDVSVQNHILYTTGSVTNHTLYVDGTVSNHILTFNTSQTLPSTPTNEDEPSTPTSNRVQNNTLYVSGSVSGRILTLSGTVNNHILTL